MLGVTGPTGPVSFWVSVEAWGFIIFQVLMHHFVMAKSANSLWLIWPKQNGAKNLENGWNPDKWVLIWKSFTRAFQWIPIWQGLNDFQIIQIGLRVRTELIVVVKCWLALRSWYSKRNVPLSWDRTYMSGCCTRPREYSPAVERRNLAWNMEKKSRHVRLSAKQCKRPTRGMSEY